MFKLDKIIKGNKGHYKIDKDKNLAIITFPLESRQFKYTRESLENALNNIIKNKSEYATEEAYETMFYLFKYALQALDDAMSSH